MSTTPIVGAIQLAANIRDTFKSGANSESLKLLKNKSLIEVASAGRVEPIVMIDADCMNVSALNDIMQTLHSMFSGYYLQAVNMVNTVGAVSVAERLAPFNPSAGRGFEEFMLDVARAYSMEEFKHRLPKRSDPKLSLEDYRPGSKDANLETIRDVTNLAVGKVFTVTLCADGHETQIPVAVRLMVHSVPSRQMVNLFANTSYFDNDMAERYHGWKSGRLEFWKDLVLCNDLIDKRIRTSIADDSGILATIRNRHSQNIGSSAINGKASVANATNLAVISTETLAAVEAEQGGSFKNSRVREAVFNSSNLMILAVVDKFNEMVVFYFRGLDASTVMSYKDLKAAGKNDGSNVVDILKAYISGAAPQL